jgi:hypothetical protein
MDLIRAYAQQVVSYLPAKGRDEVASEIYANLSEEFEDWRAGHPGRGSADFLDATKMHPMKYATQMADGSSTCLIGPRLYFSFISALKIGASITAGLYFFLAVLVALTSGSAVRSFIGVFAGLPETLLWVSAAILGVFVALEKSGEDADWLEEWSAKDLKPIDGRQPISRIETFFDLGLSTLILLWVLDIVRLPLLIQQDGAWIEDWIVSLPPWFWWVAGGLLVFDIVFSVLRLLRTHWTSRLRLTTIATNSVWIALLLFAARQPELLKVSEPLQENLSDVLPFLDRAVRGILLTICAALAVEAIVHAIRLARQR